MNKRLMLLGGVAALASICSANVSAFDKVLEPPKRVACHPHCDDIEKIVIIYAGDKKYSQYGSVLVDMVESVVSKKNNNRIRVAEISLPVPKNWYPYSKTRVRVELFVLEIGDTAAYVNIGLKMITPSGVFSALSTCGIGGDQSGSACIEARMDEFVEEAIDGFLFDQGISYNVN